MSNYLVALAFSCSLALAALQSSASAFAAAPENGDEASCSTEEVLEEQRSVDSSLLALDAGRLGRQTQAQNPVRGPLGISTGRRKDWAYFHPDSDPDSTTLEGPMFYPLNQPDQVDLVATTTKATKATAKKKAGLLEVKTTTAKPEKKGEATAKSVKIPKLKPAKKLTKKENKTRAKLAKNCELSDWGDWSICVQKDDDLSKLYYTTRYRVVITPPKPGGKRCNETEEYMPCPPVSGFGGTINLEDSVAGMGENATTNYGKPADEDEEEDQSTEEEEQDNGNKKSSRAAAPM